MKNIRFSNGFGQENGQKKRYSKRENFPGRPTSGAHGQHARGPLLEGHHVHARGPLRPHQPIADTDAEGIAAFMGREVVIEGSASSDHRARWPVRLVTDADLHFHLPASSLDASRPDLVARPGRFGGRGLVVSNTRAAVLKRCSPSAGAAVSRAALSAGPRQRSVALPATSQIPDVLCNGKKGYYAHG